MRSKLAKGRLGKCINISDINEEMVLIDGSDTDYITPSGKVYADYDNGMFYPKRNFISKHNGYVYTNVNFNGKCKSRRVHVLLANAFIPNPDPINLRVVGHLNNDKTDNRIENLYWTTNQENTQKAVDDGLNVSKKGKDNPASIPIKVIDKNSHDVVGVYWSMSECERYIENISKDHIQKVYKKPNYAPRIKKYIYQAATECDMHKYSNLLNAKLIENDISDKQPIKFILKNKITGYEQEFDNQTDAEKICGVKQASISQALSNGYGEINEWCFTKIGKIPYTDSSAYQNLLDTYDDITIQNIYTGEIKTYSNPKALKDDLGLKGHDIGHYLKTGQTIVNNWKIIEPKQT